MCVVIRLQKSLQVFRGTQVFKFYQKKNQYRAVRILFLITLLIYLMLGSVSAQITDASQRVQRGVELYKEGKFQEAISLWHSALNEYKKINNAGFAALVSENLARAYQQIGDSKQAISAFEGAVNYYQTASDLQQVGRMQTELGQVYNSIGQPRKAIALVCGEISKKDKLKYAELSASISTLQKYEEYREILVDCKRNQNTAFALAEKHRDNKGKVAAIGTLGEAYRRIGKYEIAIQFLEDAQKISEPSYQASVLNSLGNAYALRAARWELFADSAKQSQVPHETFQKESEQSYKEAYNKFQEGLEYARAGNDKPNEMRFLLNLIRLGYRAHKLKILNNQDIDKLIVSAVNLLYNLQDTSSKVYAAIDLAMLPQDITVTSPLTVPAKPKLADAEKLLRNAIKISSNINDLRAASFAWGALGHLYEYNQDYVPALKYTREAILVSDKDIGAKESSYLWEWQAGRILKAQNKEFSAVDAYQRAFRMLEEIRNNILTSERDVQFDFRDVAQPLYRELAQSQLELASAASLKTKELTSENSLKSATETIDALKLAELQDYFGNDCIANALNARKGVDNKEILGNNTAVFSSMVLENGTAILLTLPHNKIKFKWVQNNEKNVTNYILKAKVEKFRKGLRDNIRKLSEYKTDDATTLYNWIIRPFKAELKKYKIHTLIFVQDGFLRKIPMAALYDISYHKFLIEEFAISTTPNLKLTQSKRRGLKDSRALVIGVSEDATIDGKKFEKLKAVPQEIYNVKNIFTSHTLLCNIDKIKQFAQSNIICDKEFLPDTFHKVLQQSTYPIIHIATHAQFGTIPENTFIVTGQKKKLIISQLEEILRSTPKGFGFIELLSLSACETGSGDDRATLGLAGIALQAGVKSSIASLWSINDESTSILISEFYRNLRNKNTSKAKALQQAQIKLIKASDGKTPGIKSEYAKPGYWSPFILIGNWL